MRQNRIKQKTSELIAPLVLTSLAMTTGIILSSPHVSADNDSVVDKINITVPISCTLEGTGQNSHNATINNGQYNSAIGETTMKAFCNDNEGFAIYAIGYTDNANGKNVLTNSTLGSTHDIVTGTEVSGNTSNWAMKLNTTTSPTPTYPITIENSFDSFHAVPDTYTLVAKRTSGTDIGESAEGSTIQSTYQAYISPTQAAGTYTGQVKYTLIHPHDEPTPPDSMLDIGQVVNAKMKSLAAGMEKPWNNVTGNIKAIHMANSLPANFEATEANTVSTIDSKYPVYIFFDNENDAGIMYFYTQNDTVVMNPDSSRLFLGNSSLNDMTGLTTWDASNVTNMRQTFAYNSSLASLVGVEDWDTSNVTNMFAMFQNDTALADISNVSNWDTSAVVDMSGLLLGVSSLVDLTGLEEWDTGNVTNMRSAFANNSSLEDISALANWDTRSVITMQMLFIDDGSLSDVSALANWDTSNVTDMSQMLSGVSSLVDLTGLEEWDTGNVTNMRSAFANNSSLEDISALANWDTRSVITMRMLFRDDGSLSDVSALANWDTSNVTDMSQMFSRDKSIITIDVSNWDTGNVTTMNSMFQVGESYAGNGQLTEIIGLGDLDTSNVTNMTTMFYGAGNMTHYDIADWDVSKVESFNHMFCDNFKLESLDLSKWDVSNVKTMYDMFDDNYKLTTIGDISHWNTASLIDAGGWLNGAESFVGNNGTLDLSGWNTSNLKAVGEMFRATKLETVDLSGWTFDSITNDSWEGAGSGIYYETGNTSSYKGLSGMFKNASLLNTVYVSQSGLDSFNTAVNNGIDTTNMWSGSGVSGFTVKP